jgi:hypothetical protein
MHRATFNNIAIFLFEKQDEILCKKIEIVCPLNKIRKQF